MLPADTPVECPDCSTPELARRDFFRVVGATTAAAVLPAVAPLSPLAQARAARADQQATTEAMIRELFGTLTAMQKSKVVKPWDFGPKGGMPARLATHNAAIPNTVIGTEYTRPQIELLDRIFRSMANGVEGYRLLSRNGRFDNSGDFESIGAVMYGDPTENRPFSFMFAGHHLTVRCDGNSEQGAAFGGPLYYGHTPSGYATTNVFYHQTRSLMDLFGSLSDEQKRDGFKTDRAWRDGVDSVRLPAAAYKAPGVGYGSLSLNQKGLLERVMREMVSPYRRADGDEVMEIIRANGGMEKLGFVFYAEGERTAREPWTFWRLEGPGFVWSFRALPHIHTFVNVSSRLA